MRTANFRDDVLWPIVYKLGLTPNVDFLKDQAASLASYINAWVRRLYDAVDWPEWTVIGRFSPQNAPGLEHIVSYLQPPISYIQPPLSGPDEPDRPAPVDPAPLIGKVLRLYLVDPRKTWTPVDAPFRLNDHGVHCGFDHGSSVWIKFIPRTPKFTTEEWDTDVTYKKGALVYSPASGNCYISKSSGNHGHDPIETGEGNTNVIMTTEITQQFAPDNPGLPDTPQIIDVLAQPGVSVGDSLTLPLADPPPNGQIFTVAVTDATNTLLGDAMVTADGLMTLRGVFDGLASQLTTELTGFTVGIITEPLSIRLTNLSGFKTNAKYTIGPVAAYPLAIQQVQGYIPAQPGAPPTAKQIKLSIDEGQVIPGATYHLRFISLDGKEHDVVYVSLPSDDAEQILIGLSNAIIALQGADTFFTGIQSNLDAASPALIFTIATTIAKASLDAVIEAPSSIWWTYIPFPLALVDQVVRGAYADALKEEGQPDKAGPEEGQVPNEQTIRSAAYASKQFDGLSDQQIQRNRYGK